MVSSRVNDGICDCCDGTDEWEINSCENTCDEMGRAAREERERMQTIMKEGMVKRKDMQVCMDLQ